jgi:hypothetical protein
MLTVIRVRIDRTKGTNTDATVVLDCPVSKSKELNRDAAQGIGRVAGITCSTPNFWCSCLGNRISNEFSEVFEGTGPLSYQGFRRGCSARQRNDSVIVGTTRGLSRAILKYQTYCILVDKSLSRVLIDSRSSNARTAAAAGTLPVTYCMFILGIVIQGTQTAMVWEVVDK